MAQGKWIIEDPEPGIGQRVAAIPVQAAKGLQDLAELAASPFNWIAKQGLGALGGKSPEEANKFLQMRNQNPDIGSSLQKALGVTEEALNPENLLESGIQRFARTAAPATALASTGGLPSILQQLGTNALGSVAATGAKGLGAPEYIQDLAQLGTEIGSGVYSGKVPTVKSAQKKQYELAHSSLKSGEKASARPIIDSLLNIENELGTEVSEKITNKVKHAIQTVGENLNKGKIDPEKAMDLRKKLYKLRGSVPTDVHPYIDQLTKGINDTFALYSAENPQFFKHLKAGDQLTQMKNMTSVVDKFVKNIELSSLPGISALKYPAQFLAAPIIGSTEKFLRQIYNNPEAKKYYFNAVSAAAKQDPTLFIKNLQNLKTEFPEEFKEEWIIED